MSEDMSERMSNDMSERMSEDMSERMSEDMSEEMSERYVRRYVRKNDRRYVRKNVRKNVKRYVRKNVRKYVRKNVRKICQKICHQKECQKICQKEWQKIRQKDVRKNVRRYVRKNGRQNVRKYVPSIYAYTDLDNKHSCLRQWNLVDGILFLFYLAYCSKYCWLNFVFVQGSEFGLEAMVEVVVERPETIFIGTANQVAKGVEHVWRYKLTFVGAERMYVGMVPPSITHAGDLMFIMEEVVEGNKWYVAYEGRPVPNGRASKSWRSALQSFVLRPRFGRMECMNGRQTTCGAGPPMHNRRKHRSGEQLTSWFAHAMRCSCGTSNSFAFLDSTAFWRGGLMHVVCVWNYRCFASLDLIAFWWGGPMH